MPDQTIISPQELTNEVELEIKKLRPDQLRNTTMSPHKSKPSSFWHQHRKLLIKIGIVFALVVGLLTALGLYTYSVAKQLQAQASEAKITAQAAYTNFKNQDLLSSEAELKKLQAQEQTLRKTYQKLNVYNYLPWLRRYYQDGLHVFNATEAALSASLKSVEAIAPYADVLGFTGEDSFTGGTAEDRLAIVLQTLDKISPILDEISAQLTTTQNELAQINPNRYPQKLGQFQLRGYVLKAIDYGQLASQTVIQYRPVLEQLPSIMGAKGERRKYLLLFQNDNELRPTGGFMTAYATVFIENGKVTPEKSDDIYELDQKFHENIPIPEELGRYLTTETYWNLRDMNIHPDFKTSIEQFLEYYLQISGEPKDIDGVIAVDTRLLTDLLTLLGPVEVPGYGMFSAKTNARCDCPQVVYALSEIITKPTPYHQENRKGILGPMMRAILTKAYSAPKQQWPQLFQIGIENIEGRHVQLYFMDQATQAAVEAINAAGRIEPVKGVDFLAIINANLGGAKSNLFTEYEVDQVISAPENNQLQKTIEITYRNTHAADNCNLEAGELCLNATLRDWTRIYLPLGSKLIEAQGFTQDAKEYDQGEFHVIDGFFTLDPEAQAKLKITYSVPYENEQVYRLKIWKQGGIDSFQTIIDVTGGQEQLTVDQDVLYETPF